MTSGVTFTDVCVPLDAAWSSPFVRWQGPASGIDSVLLAEQVTARALARSDVEWPFEQLILGLTVPQHQSFYGAPTLAGRLGLGSIGGPMVAQACATSVACIHLAAATQSSREGGAQLVVATDRTSNGPHVVYPAPGASGGTPTSEDWVLDNFARDPGTGVSMLGAAEGVATEAGFSKQQLDEAVAVRWSQYEKALHDDRAFQRRWMVPIRVGGRKEPQTIDADWGVRPVTAEGLAGLGPVLEAGVISYAAQTHPADGSAGMVVTTPAEVGRQGVQGPIAHLLATAFARVEPAAMPKAPVPAAEAALAAIGLGFADVDVIKTHNPFVVNDLWFAQATGVALEAVNPFGSSLIYGHPQGPTGARAIVELMWALHERGGGRGLFTGCAAGDVGAALVLEVR